MDCIRHSACRGCGRASDHYAGCVAYLPTPLSGLNENPPNASTGTGTAIVTIDDVLDTMRVQATFSDLLAPSTVAHIHCCTPTPGIIPPGGVPPATTTPTFPGFPAGVTSGTYDHTFDLTDAGSYRPGFITASGGTTALAEAALIVGLEEGRAYFNIHSSVFPSGEILGFLQPVPEPSSLLLLGAAFCGMIPFIRRRYSAGRA